MYYLLIFIVVLLLIWLFLIWIRKTMWDAVHRNLLDLEDLNSGKVTRRGFASRPLYHGVYKDRDVTINFSSEKNKGKRRTYVDISYAVHVAYTFTISAKEWMEERLDDSPMDFMEYTNASGTVFMVRPASEQNVQHLLEQAGVKKILDSWNDLAYLFAGKTGLIYEFSTEEVIKSSEAKALMQRLEQLNRLTGDM